MPPNPRVARAFCAMRDLGISENKVKPVLKNLLKLYDKNWDLIEEENYRVLADAIFDSEEAEAVASKKELENTEQERVVGEETRELDEPGRPLKRLRLTYQGQASETCNNSSLLAGTSLITPKDEPVELPEVQPQNQVPSMASTKPLNNGNGRIASQHIPCQSLDRNKGKQPVSPKPLTFREISQPVSGNKTQLNIPVTIESVAVPHPSGLRNRGKEPHSASVGKWLESERSSQAVPQEKTVGDHILLQPKDEPFTGDTPVFDLALAAMHPVTTYPAETSKEEDSSKKTYSETVQNGSVPLTADSLGGKDTSNGVPAKVPDESSSQLEVASSHLGEVKFCLSYNISPHRSDFQVPSLDAVVKLVEDKYLKSYKHLDPNFSLKKLMEDMCEGVLELGFESCNKSEETN